MKTEKRFRKWFFSKCLDFLIFAVKFDDNQILQMARILILENIHLYNRFGIICIWYDLQRSQVLKLSLKWYMRIVFSQLSRFKLQSIITSACWYYTKHLFKTKNHCLNMERRTNLVIFHTYSKEIIKRISILKPQIKTIYSFFILSQMTSKEY